MIPPSVVEQNMPKPNDSEPIFDLVIKDMEARKSLGFERYGAYLQAHNGRDALIDLYQELLDACVYIRQVIEENKS